MRVTACRLKSLRTGFSLVEMSIVIAILSVVAVMGLEMTAGFMNRTAYKTTQERLAVIKNALYQYRQTYGYLPCPANYFPSTHGNYGMGDRSSGVFTTGASLDGGDTIRYGDLPARDLNLPIKYMVDGYGSKFRYVVTKQMAWANNPPSYPYRDQSGLISIRTGRLSSNCGASDPCQTIINNAAYVVLSFGADKRGGITIGNVTRPCFGGIVSQIDGMIDTANCRFGNGTQLYGYNGSWGTVSIPMTVFYDSRYNAGTVEHMHFDDLIIWQLKSQL